MRTLKRWMSGLIVFGAVSSLTGCLIVADARNGVVTQPSKDFRAVYVKQRQVEALESKQACAVWFSRQFPGTLKEVSVGKGKTLLDVLTVLGGVVTDQIKVVSKNRIVQTPLDVGIVGISTMIVEPGDLVFIQRVQ